MIDRDSTTEFLMQFDGSPICAGGSSLIIGGQTKFSGSNKKFGSGSYFSDSQLTGLGSPNPAFYQQRTPKAGYRRIEENDSRFIYQGSWTQSSGSTNTYSGTTARFTANANSSNFVAFNFTGTKLMIIGLPHASSPTAAYIRIDDKIYVVNTRMTQFYCGCIFDITDLEDKEHRCVLSSGNEYPLYFDAVDIDINAELYPSRPIAGDTNSYSRIRFESPAFNFGTNNFTISFWEYVVSGYPAWKGRLRINNHPSGFPAAILVGHTHINGNLLLYMASEGATSWDMQNGISLGAASYNQWVHWAITRQGNIFRVFKNGTQVLTFSSSLPLRSSGYSYLGLYEWSYDGQYYMDELYVNNGTCLYSANFTPPTAPYEINWGSPKDFSGLCLPESENTAERLSANITGKELETAIGIKSRNHIGKYLETLPGIKSRNHIGNELPILRGGIKSRNHKAAHLPIPEHANRLPSSFSGKELQNTERGVKSRNYNGIPLDDTIPSIRLPHNFDGIPIEITPTSNAENRFKLTVTPTHLHKLPSVVIACESKSPLSLFGKCSLKLGNTDKINLNEDYEDVRYVNFTVTPSVLSTGNNPCRISYDYPNGEAEYLDFEIFKEEPKRLQVERLFRHYEGGYDGERQNAIQRFTGVYPGFMVPEGQISTLITTTQFTRIDLRKYLSIQGVNIDAKGAKIAVSFDEGQTWKTWGIVGRGALNTSKSIIPPMLIDYMGDYTARASDFSSVYGPYRAFDGLTYHASGGYFWMSSVVTSTHWISIQMPKGIRVNGYSMIGYYLPANNPKSWRIEASNNGTTWDILDTRTSQTLTNSSKSYYTFENSTEYYYYRIVITEINNSTTVTLCELELFELTPIYGWKDVDINDIAEEGMSSDSLNSRTIAEWADVFKPKSIDFAIYLDNKLSNYYDLSIYPAEAVQILSYWGQTAATFQNQPIPADKIVTTTYISRWNNYAAGTQGRAIYSDYTQVIATPPAGSSSRYEVPINISKDVKYIALETPNVAGSGYAVGAQYEAYGTKRIAYLKSINVQITPNLKTGYAFII